MFWNGVGWDGGACALRSPGLWYASGESFRDKFFISPWLMVLLQAAGLPSIRTSLIIVIG